MTKKLQTGNNELEFHTFLWGNRISGLWIYKANRLHDMDLEFLCQHGLHQLHVERSYMTES